MQSQEQVIMVKVCSRHPLQVHIIVHLPPNEILQAATDRFGVCNFFHLILCGVVRGWGRAYWLWTARDNVRGEVWDKAVDVEDIMDGRAGPRSRQ